VAFSGEIVPRAATRVVVVGRRRRRRFAQAIWRGRCIHVERRWCGPAARQFRPPSRKFPQQLYCSAAPASGKKPDGGHPWQQANPRSSATGLSRRTRHGHSVPGRIAIANTGVSTGAQHPAGTATQLAGPGQRSVIRRPQRTASSEAAGLQEGASMAGFGGAVQALIGWSPRPLAEFAKMDACVVEIT